MVKKISIVKFAPRNICFPDAYMNIGDWQLFGFEDVVLKSVPGNSIKIGGYVPILHNKKNKWVTILIWSSRKMIGECSEVLNNHERSSLSEGDLQGDVWK